MTDQKNANESLFIVKDANEYCFLYSDRQPGKVYQALLDCADVDQSDLGTDEALEIIEEMVVNSLRRL